MRHRGYHPVAIAFERRMLPRFLVVFCAVGRVQGMSSKVTCSLRSVTPERCRNRLSAAHLVGRFNVRDKDTSVTNKYAEGYPGSQSPLSGACLQGRTSSDTNTTGLVLTAKQCMEPLQSPDQRDLLDGHSNRDGNTGGALLQSPLSGLSS